MSALKVLLFTGSRSLADRAGAMDVFGELALPMIRQSDLVIAGDARGPDARGIALARHLEKYTQKWCLDGWVVLSKPLADGTTRFDHKRWWGEHDPRPSETKWPLVRNRRMVERAAGYRDDARILDIFHAIANGGDLHEHEARLLCVGFVDPASPTKGTDNTLQHARNARIWTARYVWTGERFEEQS